MKIKLWTVFFVLLAVLCLYGCKNTELSQGEMVLKPSTVECEYLSCKISWHFQDMGNC